MTDAAHHLALAALSGTDRGFRVRLMLFGSSDESVELRCDSQDEALIDLVLSIADKTAASLKARRIGADRQQWADVHHMRAIFNTGIPIVDPRRRGRSDRPRRDRPRSRRGPALRTEIALALTEQLGLVDVPTRRRGPRAELTMAFASEGRIDRWKRYQRP